MRPDHSEQLAIHLHSSSTQYTSSSHVLWRVCLSIRSTSQLPSLARPAVHAPEVSRPRCAKSIVGKRHSMTKPCQSNRFFCAHSSAATLLQRAGSPQKAVSGICSFRLRGFAPKQGTDNIHGFKDQFSHLMPPHFGCVPPLARPNSFLTKFPGRSLVPFHHPSTSHTHLTPASGTTREARLFEIAGKGVAKRGCKRTPNRTSDMLCSRRKPSKAQV